MMRLRIIDSINYDYTTAGSGIEINFRPLKIFARRSQTTEHGMNRTRAQLDMVVGMARPTDVSIENHSSPSIPPHEPPFRIKGFEGLERPGAK
jgi:hypothetical protein